MVLLFGLAGVAAWACIHAPRVPRRSALLIILISTLLVSAPPFLSPVWAVCPGHPFAHRIPTLTPPLSPFQTVVGLYRIIAISSSTTSLLSTAHGSQNSRSAKAFFYIFHIAPEYLSATILMALNARRVFATLTDREHHPGIVTMVTAIEPGGPGVALLHWVQFKGTPGQVSGEDVFVVRGGRIVHQAILAGAE